MSDTLTPSERDKKNGRFLPGNAGNGGRKPGQRNRLGEAFLEDLRDCWNARGAEALARCATEDPSAFCKIVASLMPRDINLNVEVSAAEFGSRFAAAMALLGNQAEALPPRRPLRNAPKVIDHER